MTGRSPAGCWCWHQQIARCIFRAELWLFCLLHGACYSFYNFLIRFPSFCCQNAREEAVYVLQLCVQFVASGLIPELSLACREGLWAGRSWHCFNSPLFDLEMITVFVCLKCFRQYWRSKDASNSCTRWEMSKGSISWRMWADMPSCPGVLFDVIILIALITSCFVVRGRLNCDGYM